MPPIPRPSVLSAALALIFAGCAAQPIGEYALTSSATTSSSCSGLPTERAAAFSAAVSEAALLDLHVGSEGGGGPVLQADRRDGTRGRVPLTGEGPTWAGLQESSGVTVDEAGLGADFSAVAESETIGCLVDVSWEATLELDDDDRATGLVTVEIRDPAEVGGGCAAERCSVTFSFEGTRTPGPDPGVE